jgi:chromosome segregation ATPase
VVQLEKQLKEPATNFAKLTTTIKEDEQEKKHTLKRRDGALKKLHEAKKNHAAAVEAYEAAETPDGLKSQLEVMKPLMLKAKREANAATRAYEEKMGEKRPLQGELSRTTRDLNNLQDAKQVKLMQTQRNDQRAFEAYNWINDPQKGGRALKKKVHGPLLCELSIKTRGRDQLDHAKMVEARLPRWTKTMFVVECAEDEATLNKQFKGGLSVKFMRSTQLGQPNRKFSPVEMQRLKTEFGISGYLDQVLDGPPILLQALLDERPPIDEALVGTAKSESKMQHLGELLMNKGGSMAMAFTPAHQYTLKRSTYGQKNVTTQVKELQPSRYLNVEDTDRERQELSRQVEDIKHKLSTIDDDINVLREAKGQADSKAQKISHQRSQLQKSLQQISALEKRVQITKDKVEALEDEANESESVERELKVLLTVLIVHTEPVLTS